ncbi:MAG: PQQ-dependent sugar dehydrogenase [Lewinellaceae bacterium]|nr:PQQ-dependent sugar dehydrogenase [Lewinellaceae bacterium]
MTGKHRKPGHLLPALLLLCWSSFASAQLPPGFIQYELANGLNPTDMAVSPDGRIFITEKEGLVRIVQDGALLPDPFCILSVDDFNERGLGHITLHPAFPDSPYVYLYHTVPDGSHNRVVRVRADGNFSIPGSEEVIYDCDPKLGSVHHAGAMLFGNDGKLYISTGENGFSYPAYDLNNDLGKVLRLNPDGSIPADNPFFTTATGKYRAIYAVGFRNPFSMGVQPETGRIFNCDVGGTDWEEINDVLPGADYGYPRLEGYVTNQAVPLNYKDPFFAYDHTNGCSVIGAAFYPVAGGGFPAQYAGKFFFADYCKGYIAVLNPETGIREPDLVTGAKRPVSIRITPQGDFYYLARAGLGGGSEEDNTASTDGSLWRVVYVGGNAPYVYSHPKSGLYSEGDTLSLQVLALGNAPLSYRWQKNDADIPGALTGKLTFNGVQLQDSGALYRCIVKNPFGSDTSKSAMLRVTANKRPEPYITLPDPDFLYRAGEEIPFAGTAEDAEEGALGPDRLAWKIDFHHDDHIHPALTPFSGVSEGFYYVLQDGEPDDNVWYRIYLTATDSVGLSKTTKRDVYPQKTEITVLTEPPGIPVSADGINGTAPFSFLSVTGLHRTVSVPEIIFSDDSILVFDRWESGETFHEVSFTTPETSGTPLKAIYNIYRYDEGNGLYGEYFQIDDYLNGVEGTMLLSRVDSVVNFEWLDGTPEPGHIPKDKFSVRWTGEIVPFFSDTLTLYTITDDGVRLWIDDSLVIDHWIPQPQLEYSTRLAMEGGRHYSIRMEFFELGGDATARLLWSGDKMPKSVVPSSQLFPPKLQMPNKMNGSVWLDENADGIFDPPERPLKGAAVILFDINTDAVAGAATADAAGFYELKAIPSGEYRAYVLPPIDFGALSPGFGLNGESYSSPVAMEGDEEISRNFGFVPVDPADQTGRSWDVSPNPGTGLFILRRKFNARSNEFDIQVYNRAGKVVLEKHMGAFDWETSLDLTGMAHGIYSVIADGHKVRIALVR